MVEENLKKLQDLDYKHCERVITVEESWIHHYNPELKCEREMWLLKGEGKHREVRQ